MGKTQFCISNERQSITKLWLWIRCVCCSLRKDIVKAFAEIERRSKGREKPVDAIIMETTGLADPAPVAFTFFANPWVASRFKLDSIMWVSLIKAEGLVSSV